MSLHSRLPGTLKRFKVSTRGVIHVGAHAGQEFPYYERCGFARQVWIEPQPDIYARLRANLPNRPEIRSFNVACGSAPGRASMHVLSGNDGQSNSLLDPKEHLKLFADFQKSGTIEVDVVRLDDLLGQNGLAARDYSLLSLDTQGFELEVLKGASDLLSGLEAIIAEVTDVELYAGGPQIGDLDAFLAPLGFRRVASRIGRKHFGDALFVRESTLSRWQKRRLDWFGVPRR